MTDVKCLWPSRSHFLGYAEHDPEPSFQTALKLLHQPHSAPLWSLHIALHSFSLSTTWDVLQGSAVSQAVPEITMHNCCLLRFRKMQRQPLNESLHGWDNVSFHSSILLCPGLNLLLNVITCKKGTKAFRERDRHKEASKEMHKRCMKKKSNRQADLSPASCDKLQEFNCDFQGSHTFLTGHWI